MAYNVVGRVDQYPGDVPFIDSDHARFIRGGLTIDHAQVLANIANSAGQVILRTVNGAVRAILRSGSFICRNPGTGKWDVYCPVAATPATLDTGVVGANNAITWTSVAAALAANNIRIRYVDTRVTPTVLACNVGGNDITVTLADDGTGVYSTGNTGAGDSGIAWTSRLPGVDGDAITISIVNDGTLGRAAIAVKVVGTTIIISPVTDGATGVITSTANDIIAAVAADPAAKALVAGVATGTGADPVTGNSVTLAGGVDSAPASTANDVMAIVAATPAAAALLSGASTGASTGLGVVTAMDYTNLAGGTDGSNAVAAGLQTGRASEDTLINWRHVTPGAAGNAVQISYVHPGPGDNPFAVATPGGNIVVTLQTVGGVLVQTAAQVVAAIIADGTAAGIAVPALGCVGDGIVQPMAPTNMVGGLDAGLPNIVGRQAAILFEDVDIQDADAVATGIDHGRVITARLPLAPDAFVTAALPGVLFK